MGNSIQPGVDFGVAAKLLPRFVSRQERFLGQIGGFFVVPNPLINRVENLLAVACIQRIKVMHQRHFIAQGRRRALPRRPVAGHQGQASSG